MELGELEELALMAVELIMTMTTKLIILTRRLEALMWDTLLAE